MLKVYSSKFRKPKELDGFSTVLHVRKLQDDDDPTDKAQIPIWIMWPKDRIMRQVCGGKGAPVDSMHIVKISVGIARDEATKRGVGQWYHNMTFGVCTVVKRIICT